jgi:hypothetical protein
MLDKYSSDDSDKREALTWSSAISTGDWFNFKQADDR